MSLPNPLQTCLSLPFEGDFPGSGRFPICRTVLPCHRGRCFPVSGRENGIATASMSDWRVPGSSNGASDATRRLPAALLWGGVQEKFLHADGVDCGRFCAGARRAYGPYGGIESVPAETLHKYPVYLFQLVPWLCDRRLRQGRGSS